MICIVAQHREFNLLEGINDYKSSKGDTPYLIMSIATALMLEQISKTKIMDKSTDITLNSNAGYYGIFENCKIFIDNTIEFGTVKIV